MEIVVGLIVIGIAVILFISHAFPSSLDANSDGKVDLQDAEKLAKDVFNKTKSAADLNKDGVVNAEDAKVAATKIKEAADKSVKKVKSKIKK
jgi:preprotein translocase subunit SecF